MVSGLWLDLMMFSPRGGLAACGFANVHAGIENLLGALSLEKEEVDLAGASLEISRTSSGMVFLEV